ncbi:hypothetical protein A2738_03235 [Candidatus Nomurabacteria bacterium RIFCSPHIGHO2_01_FULL_42_15]|uniref:Uncharacterized protein n=1 Tax=Candidatus Nomurabacteria bacterium RIFCSPHIGHO2_01_FULL_42_15 TaxID=1801742 RepID=A0A1F6VE61_9BACT|nr:MAG: hypothetical protein A2738_03235 [Candidatus Nomurabacteria bacterium RIFCSPHIGHO2_01_FULL_42_15]OGI92930.1 MAG: hypothetical protein A3A99_00080 [Candidatus Nomurabacteria bacterium RIFCSPLOWO2_01_FULL_41_18]
MPSDTWSPKPAQPHKSLESLKLTFKQKLDVILGKQLTVENIETFANEALSETVKLTDDVLNEYRENPNLYPNQIPLDKQVQENEAFAILGLPNISEILQSIIDVKSRIDALGKYINESNIVTNKVVIPPQHDSPLSIKNGTGTGIEQKKLIPRLITLLYILESDFDIQKEQVKITEGKVIPEMVRKTPYVRVEVEDLERTVYICDEEGNASYVFDAEKLKGAGITTENLDLEDKGNMNELIAKHPGIGARIIQTKYWRVNIAELLENQIPETYTTTKTSELPVSEFTKKEKKNFLAFEDFQREVKALYPGEGRIIEWYRSERPNHTNWPSAPNDKYKHRGWIGWSELVGKENRFKDYPSFEDFQVEIINLYPGEGEIGAWYEKERTKHINWPSAPYRIYKDKGWVGWPELVGKENMYRKEHLSFADFQSEVRALYPGEGSVITWYMKEKKKHRNWYSDPQRVYGDKVWQGWPELVGIENVKKKEYPSFQNFQTEVRAVYTGKDNIGEWYDEEILKHSDWPYKPDRKYKEEGWQGWPELVGRENRTKKEFLSFENFQSEVIALYPGKGSVQKWYFSESPQHWKWPSDPDRKYKDKGWKSWSELVGKKKE